ncbi:MAG: pyridoxal phosphate-dependent aminotransferase [Oscillospiraceae bacterium]|nr:pyridoxal phosphate-dependent aminotransferase [Oscillospiraceae bacterium]
MAYDFDKIINRRGTYSMKYDPVTRGKPEDVLPMWVADMDFAAPECVINAINEQAEHGIFGYFKLGQEYFSVLQNWFARRHNWTVQPDWLVTTPGVVNAIHVAIMALTDPGDGIIIQQPAYYPFLGAVAATERRLVVNQLTEHNGRYGIDFDDFERQIIQENVKVFILCNPHNPVGRVFTAEELVKLGEICLRHKVYVIADEVHQDIVYNGHNHLVFAGLNEDFSNITVTCTAPTKTFNLASLPVANIFISNEKMRKRFLHEYDKFGVSQIGVMEIAACVAAYTDGEEWLGQLLGYLSDNMKLIDDFLKTKLPQVKLIKPEATYLAWFDFRELGISDDELDEIITNKAKLWLHRGTTFGAGGKGFMRMNIACPRSILQQALEQMEEGIASYSLA